MLEVRDTGITEIDDTFAVCSHASLENPLQRMGMELKRRWMEHMIEMYGSCTKVAYIDRRPVAQMLFYPEDAAPFILNPRRGVVLLRCVYNPFPEARGKGAATALIRSLEKDCSCKPRVLREEECSFIATEAFNTGEGAPMAKLYAAAGFVENGGEMVKLMRGEYVPSEKLNYVSSEEDRGRAVVLYNPTCEYSYVFALRTKERLSEIIPSMPVELVNQWEMPEESVKRANMSLTVNGVPISSLYRDAEVFDSEVRRALARV